MHSSRLRIAPVVCQQRECIQPGSQFVRIWDFSADYGQQVLSFAARQVSFGLRKAEGQPNTLPESSHRWPTAASTNRREGKCLEHDHDEATFRLRSHQQVGHGAVEGVGEVGVAQGGRGAVDQPAVDDADNAMDTYVSIFRDRNLGNLCDDTIEAFMDRDPAALPLRQSA